MNSATTASATRTARGQPRRLTPHPAPEQPLWPEEEDRDHGHEGEGVGQHQRQETAHQALQHAERDRRDGGPRDIPRPPMMMMAKALNTNPAPMSGCTA